MTDKVKVTPILGGRSGGGVSSILEIGNVKILLDCGSSEAHIQATTGTNEGSEAASSSGASVSDGQRILNAIQKCGGIDAIVISHADVHHMGSLPIVLGQFSKLPNPTPTGTATAATAAATTPHVPASVPIFATWPVYKFGQMFLYDLFLNWKMEGTINAELGVQSNAYDLDDVDLAFSHIHNLKFSENASLEAITRNPRHNVHFCAFPTGRTIGGTIWRIRHGATEVVYAMDVNLRREIVLEGADMTLLPQAPALLIVEGASAASSLLSSQDNDAMLTKKDRSGDMQRVIDSAVATLRKGSNVLIPCETGGRTFELLQAFAKYWLDSKLGLYHLIFLSHMSMNVLEFAKSQLEWMNPTLSKPFFNGRRNPFDLAPLKLFTTVKDMEKKCLGPKVVFATDPSLTCGLSKEILLRWGGDPRCKVIFVDTAGEGTLAAEIQALKKNPSAPVIVSVTRPQRMELVGEELDQYNRELERQQRAKEEASLRELMEKELALLEAERDPGDESDSSDDEQQQSDGSALSLKRPAGTARESSISIGPLTPGGNARKTKMLRSVRFSEPVFPMVQTREQIWTVDEFGVLNNDLKFQDITTGYLAGGRRTQSNQPASAKGNAATGESNEPAEGSEASAAGGSGGTTAEMEAAGRFKTVAVKTRVQLTCEIVAYPQVSSRADLKAIKSFVSRINPAKVIVLRGPGKDCDAIVKFAKAQSIDASAPENLQSISFNAKADKVRVQISQEFLPSNMKTIKGLTAAGQETTCLVSAISGPLQESADSGRDGIRMVKLLGSEVSLQVSDVSSMHVTAQDEDDAEKGGDGAALLEVEGDGMDEQKEAEGGGGTADADAPIQPISFPLGAISVGEVTLSALKQVLEQQGLSVEFQIGASGGMLVCGGQVIIRRDEDNDFVIEGPPTPAYYVARKALYQQFAFI